MEMLTEPIFERPKDDYLRVMTVSPEVAIADPATNTERIAQAYQEAREQQVELLVTPELSVTGYSAADLFHNDHVLERTTESIQSLAALTANGPAMLVGAPLRHRGLTYNCAVMLAEGEIKGAVPKVHLPNYNEFYEMRWFTSGKQVQGQEVTVGEQTVPFGTDILFKVNGTTVGAEICEDAWAPITPAANAALAGAEVIVNLSASNELIGKTGKRRQLVSETAGRLICGYVYASAGNGESTADLIYGGHQIIGELGRLTAERLPHSEQNSLVYDIDRAYIARERAVSGTFSNQAADVQAKQDYRTVHMTTPRPEHDLMREVNPLPYVPRNPETRNERCEEIMLHLARNYAQRLREAGSDGISLGLSGGLDSTLGLIIALEAAKLLGKENDFIHTITMPGPASSERTQDNATLLAEALGTTRRVVPIGELSDLLLKTIGHDGETEDITYENTQARLRTSILMNYANMIGGVEQGTGDMSEAMQGWCTYNGDHMSMFNPNASIPKTLVRYLVQWYADFRADDAAAAILRDIVDTPVSPELTGTGDLSQETNDILGPDDLRDFFGFEHSRRGSRPAKVGYLATKAFAEKYDEKTIEYWLEKFYRRYTKSQWKREAAANGPKIGSVSVSPRGDLRMAPNTSLNWYK